MKVLDGNADVEVSPVNPSLPPPPPYEQVLALSTQPFPGSSDQTPHQFTAVLVPMALPGQTGVQINPMASAAAQNHLHATATPQSQQQQAPPPIGFNLNLSENQQSGAPAGGIPSLPPTTDGLAIAPQYQPQKSQQQLQQPAYTIERTSDGIETADVGLNSDPKALLNFFVNNCSAPQMFVNIRGHHIEHRTRRVARHHNGHTHYHTEHYTVDVTDFIQTYDLTPYIDPTGMIYTVPDQNNQFLTVPQLLEQYVKNQNKFKSLVLNKFVQWEFQELQQAIVGAIRQAGFYKQLTITFPKQQHQVSVHTSHCLGRCARNEVVRALCIVSCLWIIGLPFYLITRKRYGDTLRADFKMRISPRDWFYANYASIMTHIRY